MIIKNKYLLIKLNKTNMNNLFIKILNILSKIQNRLNLLKNLLNRIKNNISYKIMIQKKYKQLNLRESFKIINKKLKSQMNILRKCILLI